MKSRLPILEQDDGYVEPVRTLLCQEGKTTNGSGHPPPKTQTGKSLTHFTDGKGAGVASVDLGRPAPGEVKQLHQAGDHFVLLLSVAQPAVATEAPGEDALLGVQDQLREKTQGGDRPGNRRGPGAVAQGKGASGKHCRQSVPASNRARGQEQVQQQRMPFSLPETLLSVPNYYFKSQAFPSPHQKLCLQSKLCVRLPCFPLDSPPTNTQVTVLWSLVQ